MKIVDHFDPGNPDAAHATTFNSNVSNGAGRIVVYNESNVNIALQWGSFQTYCPAWYAVLYCVSTSNPNISWSVQSVLNAQPGPISQVLVELYDNSEAIVGTYPAPINRNFLGNTIPLSTSATSVANDGNVSGTSAVEATVSGQGSSTVQLLNQGKLNLGNNALPGNVSIVSEAPNSNHYTDVIDLGNGTQIGVFGSAGVDIQILTNGIIVFKVGGVQIAHIGAGGVVLDNGTLTLLAGSLSRLKYTHIASVTTTAAFVNHNLGVIPDYCFLIPNDGVLSTGVFSAYYESGSMTLTQVKLQSNSLSGIPVGLIAVKL